MSREAGQATGTTQRRRTRLSDIGPCSAVPRGVRSVGRSVALAILVATATFAIGSLAQAPAVKPSASTSTAAKSAADKAAATKPAATKPEATKTAATSATKPEAKPEAKPPTTAAAKPAVVPDAPKPKTARAWLVMDDATGKILAGQNIDERLEPASLTKVMTAYVIAAELQAGRIQAHDAVKMSVNAWQHGGGAVDGRYSGFEVNKTADLTEMLKGMLVQSSNDVAVALAEHVAGSEPAFAALMNDYAKRLDLENTRFATSHGLSAENHYSTARDLALLGRAFVHDYPNEYAYTKIREFRVGAMNPLLNRNVLLWRDESVDGIKTGDHARAGYCMLTSAKRGDQRLFAVVLKAASEEERAVDSLALLNWGFRFYETHRLYQADAVIATHKIWKGETDTVKLGLEQPLLVSTPRGRYAELKPLMDVPKRLIAPVKAGTPIGTVRVVLDGKTVIEAPLVAMESVPEAGFFKRLWHEFLMWWESV
ncbi:MAG: D-alanyl-D-alanine carboxypeptidase [Lysobacter sp.]|nr:D-alanyl-D-alanine carboxypeptidase [Lysobacter sp.]